MTHSVDEDLIRQALALAEKGWGRVHPNPMVGALVVQNGRIVGRGFHEQFGGPHAEVNALREAGEAARGATLYVTLEPCSHFGKTPPCTEGILQAGIARVVFGSADPNPAAGGGAQELRDAGIEVDGGVCATDVRRLNAAFFHALERGTTYLALKYAVSLDFRIAARPGERTQLSGELAMARTHALRAGYDAILVGIGTALVDDPLLTVRGAVEPRVPPARIVVDANARLPLDSNLVKTIDQAPVLLFCAGDASSHRCGALEQAGVRVFHASRGPEGLDLESVLDTLWREDIRSVLVEGGSRVATSLLAADRVERMHLFITPHLLGEEGVPAFGSSVPVETLFHTSTVEQFGDDLYIQLERMRELELAHATTHTAADVHGTH